MTLEQRYRYNEPTLCVNHRTPSCVQLKFSGFQVTRQKHNASLFPAMSFEWHRPYGFRQKLGCKGTTILWNSKGKRRKSFPCELFRRLTVLNGATDLHRYCLYHILLTTPYIYASRQTSGRRKLLSADCIDTLIFVTAGCDRVDS